MGEDAEMELSDQLVFTCVVLQKEFGMTSREVLDTPWTAFCEMTDGLKRIVREQERLNKKGGKQGQAMALG
jgi:hypothetical protein